MSDLNKSPPDKSRKPRTNQRGPDKDQKTSSTNRANAQRGKSRQKRPSGTFISMVPSEDTFEIKQYIDGQECTTIGKTIIPTSSSTSTSNQSIPTLSIHNPQSISTNIITTQIQQSTSTNTNITQNKSDPQKILQSTSTDTITSTCKASNKISLNTFYNTLFLYYHNIYLK